MAEYYRAAGSGNNSSLSGPLKQTRDTALSSSNLLRDFWNRAYLRYEQESGGVRKMTRYIALLRGINISGKNKISMSELKAALIEKGFTDASTYLNSGNIIFSDGEADTIVLAEKIKALIQEKFSLDIPVFVIAHGELKTLLTKAPAWWGTEDKAVYDNLIFAIPPHDIKAIAEKIGEPTKELEQVEICGNAAFWSFDRKNYAKAAWWKKTASSGIGELITIRTANTLRKIAGM